MRSHAPMSHCRRRWKHVQTRIQHRLGLLGLVGSKGGTATGKPQQRSQPKDQPSSPSSPGGPRVVKTPHLGPWSVNVNKRHGEKSRNCLVWPGRGHACLHQRSHRIMVMLCLSLILESCTLSLNRTNRQTDRPTVTPVPCCPCPPVPASASWCDSALSLHARPSPGSCAAAAVREP